MGERCACGLSWHLRSLCPLTTRGDLERETRSEPSMRGRYLFICDAQARCSGTVPLQACSRELSDTNAHPEGPSVAIRALR